MSIPGLFSLPISSLIAQANPQGDAGPMSFFAILAIYAIPIMFLWYFLIGRPQREHRRKMMEMLSALKKNDRVLTEAGIFGTVVSIDPEADKVVLRIDDEKGVKLTCRKTSVVFVEGFQADKERDKDKEKEKASSA